MRILAAINSAVVDMFHMFFAPVQEGQDRDTASDWPLWARAVVGWSCIALLLGSFALWG